MIDSIFHTSRLRGKFLSIAFTWPFFLLYQKFTNSLASPFSPLSGPTRITNSMKGQEQLDTKTEEREINSQLMVSCFHFSDVLGWDMECHCSFLFTGNYDFTSCRRHLLSRLSFSDQSIRCGGRKRNKKLSGLPDIS